MPEIRFERIARWGLALALAFAAGPVLAQTLYKLVDRKGKVTYSETAPKNFDGTVTRIDVDPKSNTMVAPRLPEPKPRETRSDDAPAGKAPAASREDRIRAARERFEAAKKEYEFARDNPGEDDVRRVGNVKGGARPVPTEEYQARLAALAQRVEQAEAELQALERGR